MNRPLTALFAGLEALLVVGVGIGIPLVPLTLMWALQYGLQLDWVLFWRGSVDAWLLGHGTDVRFTLDPALAAATGLPGAADPFVVTIAPLGFALVTFLLAVRAGRRIGETPYRHIGHLASIAVFGLLAFAVTITALDPAARPSIWQGTLLPTAVFALGVAVGSAIVRARLRERTTDAVPRAPLPALVGRARDLLPPALLPAARIAVTGGAGAAMLLVAASAVALAAVTAVHYGTIIGLYEGVQSGVLGGAALTAGQLAALPNLVVFSASWLVGPGFAIGTGSSVGPLATALGPVPALPILGALPQGGGAFAFAWLIVPIVAGFVAALAVRPRLEAAGLTSFGVLLGVAAGMGVAGGGLLALLCWVSSGAAGPGRLAEVGPTWWLVGLVFAIEVALPAAISFVVSGMGADEHPDADEVREPAASAYRV